MSRTNKGRSAAAREGASATPLPGGTKTGNDYVASVVKRLEEAQGVLHLPMYRLFDSWLELCEAALEGREFSDPEGFAALLEPLKPAWRLLSEALGDLMSSAVESFEDILANVYMTLGQSEKRLGQFFTPWHLAVMMAEMVCGNIEAELEQRRDDPSLGPITICDPACGSGTLLMAYLDVVARKAPWALSAGLVAVYGMDIDVTCVRMARVNVLMHRYVGVRYVPGAADALIARKDSLTQEPLADPVYEPSGPAKLRAVIEALTADEPSRQLRAALDPLELELVLTLAEPERALAAAAPALLLDAPVSEEPTLRPRAPKTRRAARAAVARAPAAAQLLFWQDAVPVTPNGDDGEEA